MAAVRSRLGFWLQGKLEPIKQWHKDAISRQMQGFTAEVSAPTAAAAAAGLIPETIPYKKLGWGRKFLGGAFLLYLGMNAYPIVSEGSLKHGVLLLQRKDEFFKRTGASRLTTFALTDGRRKQAVQWGAIYLLVDMLRVARDDRTRIAALKSMSSLTQCDAAIHALQRHGARGLLQELAETSSDPQILSLIRDVQDKMKKANVKDSSHISVGGASVLTH